MNITEINNIYWLPSPSVQGIMLGGYEWTSEGEVIQGMFTEGLL